MASREEAKKMKDIVSKYGLRDYRLDPVGDPVVYSRTRGENKDELFLYTTTGSSNLAAFIYGRSPRKLGSKLKKLSALGCRVLQQSGEEATVRFPNTKIREVSKFLKCDKIVRRQSKKQLENLKRLAASRRARS
tara:strand:- start:4036 stop:4437 length:402 start_codon:yes stop_codon:yes gene_type:complete